MCLPKVGDYRVVLQQYEYAAHQVFCVFKIRADSVIFFERQPEKDFNWMTDIRWMKLESSLWKLFSSISNWQQDANELKTELIIDHIKVSVQSREKLLSAAQELLPDTKSARSDVCLEITLQYMSHDEATILNSQPIKRKQTDNNKERPKYKAIGSSSKSKTKSNEKMLAPDLPETQDESSKNSRGTSGALSRKRDRRSISHDGSRNDVRVSPKDGDPSSRGKRLKSPAPRASSAERKPERRSARSPVKPSRFKEYQLGETKSRKTKSKSSASSEDSRKPTKVKEDTSGKSNGNPDYQQHGLLNGAQINVNTLKEINEMLEIPRPREVEILLLKDMDEATVLKTFDDYRVDFDRLFKEREHKSQTINHMSIDHCHTMDILSKSIREQMIKKLGEVYSKKGPHCSLVINGLLPLWIIRLFMDRYNFSKTEAVRQISDQLKYNTYLKAINNEPLSSDLED